MNWIGRKIWLAILTLLFSSLLVGCTWTDTLALSPEHKSFELYGSRTIEQTFYCHHAGLESIDILLEAQPNSGDILLHLWPGADRTAKIATASVPPQAKNGLSFYRFEFPIQDDVNGQSFHIQLESPDTSQESAIHIPYSSPSGLSKHALYLDHTLTPGQLSMQLNYSSLYIIKDLVRQAAAFGAKTAQHLVLSALLYLLPGGAAVVWLLPGGEDAGGTGRVERLCLVTGLSVALNGLLIYATMTGLRLNRAAIIGYLVLCAVLIAARCMSGWRRIALAVTRLRNPASRPSYCRGAAWIKRELAALTLLVVFVLVLGVRLFVVRDLVAPMWGDSYQHAMVSQLMVDHGGLFDSWEPYAPIATFTYHFGFQGNVAIFSWLSGDSILESTIWLGQILNVLAVLALYPLATRISGNNRWAGIGAVLTAGLLSPMPMYYVNWGRYTQLAGQVILPAAMWLTCLITEGSRWNWKQIAALVLSLAGLSITHYRVVMIYGAFVVAWGIVFLFREWRKWRKVGRAVLSLAVAGVLVLLLFVPWVIHMFQAWIPTIGHYLIQEGNQSEFHRQEYNAVGEIFPYVPLGLLLASIGAFAWQALKRPFSGWLMALWVGGLVILSNPYLVYLPGAGIINNFTILIMLYIPASVLIGIGFGHAVTWVSQWPNRKSALAVLIALAILCAGWGTWRRVQDLNTNHALLTLADIKAMAWIRENTPPDARFLINGFLAYGDTSVVGADAGWWIALLTGRQSTIPPLLYSMEANTDPRYMGQVKSDFQYIQQVRPTSSQGAQFLRDRQITHIYIGQGNGMIGNPGPALLNVDELRNDPAYHLVYNQDQVWIFELLREPES